MTWVLDLVNMQRIHWDVYQPESYVDCGWRNKTLTLTTTCNGIRRNRCAECSPVTRMFDSNFLGKVNFSAKSEVADMLSISTLMASDSSGVVSHLQSQIYTWRGLSLQNWQTQPGNPTSTIQQGRKQTFLKSTFNLLLRSPCCRSWQQSIIPLTPSEALRVGIWQLLFCRC